MFWDLFQQQQIGRLESKASRAQSDVDRSARHLKQLDDKVDSLALACHALWELLRDRTGLTEEELEQKMEEVDLRDGRLDGKLSAVANVCDGCGRKTSRKRPNCLYCGVVASAKPGIFDRG